MKKNYIARRRGTSVAAAALSFALVAPFAQPVAVAQDVVTTAAEANLDDAIDANAQIIDADPIASKRITRPDHLTNPFGAGYGLLSGHVTEATPGDALSANPRTSGGTGGLPAPEGTYVYAQFRDVDGSVSPIFRTQVHNLEGTIVGLNGGQGTFAFGLPEVEEQLEVPEVTAEPGTPEYEEQLKAQEEAAQKLEEQQTNIPESVSGTKRRGGMEWVDANGKVHRFHAHPSQQYRLWVDPYENERGQLVEPFRQINGVTPGSFVGVTTNQNNGAWPNSRASMALTGMVMKERPADWMVGPDSPALKNAVHDEQGPISNPATTTELDRYIAGKVWLEAGNGTSITNAPNKDSRDRPAAGYRVYAATLTREGAIANEEIKKLEDPAERTEATRKMLEDHPEYILKTVWGTTDQEGNYTLRFDDAENPSTEDTDYWDPNNLFMWVTDPSGENALPTYSPYVTNSFYHFNDNPSWSSGTPYWRPVRKAVDNAHFGVMVNELQNLDITNYDAFANPASPGDTAEIEVSGTFPPFDAESDWVNVVWRDSNGNELKRCDQIGTAAQASECSLEIPADVADGEVITASLEIGGRVVSADSLLVVDRERDNSKYTPEYTDGEVSQDPTKPLVIDAPKNTQPDADGNVQPLPEGTKFAPGNQVVGPDGPLTDDEDNPAFPDWITVNEDGTIEVNPTVETPVGDYKVPVVVTYPDGTRETIYANVKVTPKVPNQNLDFEPGYEDGSGKPGEDVKVPAPEFKDKDGKETKAPEDTKFTPGENAPDGVKVDENTGEITVPVPEDANPGDKITVPVEVTYPDGSKDNVDVTVTVEEPDTPAPVEEDKDKFEPGYEDGSGKPGEDVKVPAPEFKD
ncbi:YPDG domain-containing protein, partial [Corynebacterium pilbarense]|uniref:YPDG domain-containing protein n=1 Tax=Corynebacterium pilbarense TaxID=1288393 RepID=UPI002342F6E6